MNKKYEIDMCSGSVFGKMLLFALPLMCSSILQLLFNAADIVVVGRFAGDNALAAVGSNTALINLLTNLFVGLSVGTNVLTAQYYGAKRERDLKETVHTSMLLSLYSGLLLMVVGLIGAPKLLALMQAPPEVLDLAVLYLRIYFLGMASMMVYNFGSAILRAVGDTKRPLYYLLGAGIVNVVLNLIFVIVCHLGVAGVAMAMLPLAIVPSDSQWINMLAAVLVIAAVTLTASLAGLLLGRRSRDRIGWRAELVGGVILVLIGVKVLVEHLTD